MPLVTLYAVACTRSGLAGGYSLEVLIFTFDGLGLFASTKATLDKYKDEEDENQNDDEDDDRDANHHPEVEVVFRLDIAHT